MNKFKKFTKSTDLAAVVITVIWLSGLDYNQLTALQYVGLFTAAVMVVLLAVKYLKGR